MGKRLGRTVPLNSTGSCGMTATADRKAFRPRVAMSVPSITMRPLSSSTRRKRAVTKEDLPAPVDDADLLPRLRAACAVCAV